MRARSNTFYAKNEEEYILVHIFNNFIMKRSMKSFIIQKNLKVPMPSKIPNFLISWIVKLMTVYPTKMFIK